MKLWNREPVAVLALVQTILGVVLAFGLTLSQEQVGAIMAAAAAVLGFVARTQVSPVSSIAQAAAQAQAPAPKRPPAKK
jgi:hypothetical protein